MFLPPEPPAPSLPYASVEQAPAALAVALKDRLSDGPINVALLAKAVGASPADLAASIGLPADDPAAWQDELAQARLVVLIRTLVMSEGWAKGPDVAMDDLDLPDAWEWFRTARSSACGDRTSYELIAEGKSAVLVSHLNRKADGGYE